MTLERFMVVNVVAEETRTKPSVGTLRIVNTLVRRGYWRPKVQEAVASLINDGTLELIGLTSRVRIVKGEDSG